MNNLKKIQIQVIISIIFTAIVITITVICKLNAVIALLILAVLYIGNDLAFYIHRKHSIMKMTNDIDAILHGMENISLSDYSEDELSILRSEISKMTIMLKSQADMLNQEKVHLADALADISHQIRTPLTSLNIMLASIKNENVDVDKRIKTAYEMDRQLERIDRLVVSLLKVAKMDAGAIKLSKDKVSLNEIVRNSLSAIEIMLELKEIETVVLVEGEFVGDKQWTEEAITNILKNCMEHTAVGGRLSIVGKENAVFTELVIEDTGIGITKEDLPHIFERFYRGEGNKENSFGIGLALAKSIITSQNGTIKVENIGQTKDSETHGARFIIRIYKSTL